MDGVNGGEGSKGIRFNWFPTIPQLDSTAPGSAGNT